MNQIFSLYNQFLSLFPVQWHFWISLIIFLVLIFWLLDLVKRNIVWLVLLIIFIPASIPLLKQIFAGIISFLKMLLGQAGF